MLPVPLVLLAGNAPLLTGMRVGVAELEKHIRRLSCHCRQAAAFLLQGRQRLEPFLPVVMPNHNHIREKLIA